MMHGYGASNEDLDELLDIKYVNPTVIDTSVNSDPYYTGYFIDLNSVQYMVIYPSYYGETSYYYHTVPLEISINKIDQKRIHHEIKRKQKNPLTGKGYLKSFAKREAKDYEIEEPLADYFRIRNAYIPIKI